MIEVNQLSKTYGSVKAVQGLTFAAQPGRVTGFLGPNGAGKTTTLRMLLGLVKPTGGSALVNGLPYGAIERPAATVGSVLDPMVFHPGRSGINHLRVYAPRIGVTESRCHEVLEFVGLTDAATRRVGGYSLGMRQRLALAFALLAEPGVLVLDEPTNGLDPQGIVWLRNLLRSLAGEGRTVLVSSHVLGEVQSTVDDVVVIAGGRLVHASSLEELRGLAGMAVALRSPDPSGVERLIADRRWAAERHTDHWVLSDLDTDEVGAAAFAAGVELHELSRRETSLEDVFLDMTRSAPSQAVTQR